MQLQKIHTLMPSEQDTKQKKTKMNRTTFKRDGDGNKDSRDPWEVTDLTGT